MYLIGFGLFLAEGHNLHNVNVDHPGGKFKETATMQSKQRTPLVIFTWTKCSATMSTTQPLMNVMVISSRQTTLRLAIVHFVIQHMLGAVESFLCIYVCIPHYVYAHWIPDRVCWILQVFFLCSLLYFDVIKVLHVHTYPSLVYVSSNRIFWSFWRWIQKLTS